MWGKEKKKKKGRKESNFGGRFPEKEDESALSLKTKVKRKGQKSEMDFLI